jgi:glycosyltransferase involved in cell wall biosynthesis
MFVISIGYGRQMFNSENPERKRMELCAAEVEELHLVIFTLKTDNLKLTKGQNGLSIHPTNSKNKFAMVFDAFKIASKIISGSSHKIVVTTQDAFEAGIVGYFLQQRFRINLTVQEHADVFMQNYWRKESFLNQFRYRAGLFVLNRADTVRTVSDRITQKMKKLNLKANLTQLPVAIDPKAFTVQLEKTNKDKEVFTFLTMARFVKQKNLALLLNAFYKVWQVCPQARLVIVGRGPETEKLKFIIKDQYNEVIPVRFIDWVDNPSELMSTADAYVLSSNYEGWGRVLVEAMLMRLPVVTTDVGCVGEVLINDEHGLVVPVNDETALAKAMTEMAVDKEKYHRIKTNLNNLDTNSLNGLSIENYGPKWAQSLT